MTVVEEGIGERAGSEVEAGAEAGADSTVVVAVPIFGKPVTPGSADEPAGAGVPVTLLSEGSVGGDAVEGEVPDGKAGNGASVLFAFALVTAAGVGAGVEAALRDGRLPAGAEPESIPGNVGKPSIGFAGGACANNKRSREMSASAGIDDSIDSRSTRPVFDCCAAVAADTNSARAAAPANLLMPNSLPEIHWT